MSCLWFTMRGCISSRQGRASPVLVSWCSYSMIILVSFVNTIFMLAWRSSMRVVKVSIVSAAIGHDVSIESVMMCGSI